MRTRPTSTIARVFGLTSLLLLILTLAVGLSRAQVTPTSEWVNFFSANSTVLGEPVPAGAKIAAFDPDGTQCAQFEVLFEGAYGLMPCYRDEKPPSPTPDLVDEGADQGDAIAFYIDGQPATPEAVSLNGVNAEGTPVTWTTVGDLWEVDLHVVASPTPSPTPTVPIGRPVGGYAKRLSALELLAPWFILAIGLAAAAIGAVWVRRRIAA